MKKLRGSRGVTLTETLCTVLIVLLISAMLAVGVRFAVRTYRESMELSEPASPKGPNFIIIDYDCGAEVAPVSRFNFSSSAFRTFSLLLRPAITLHT